jgi:hypothetical protein
MDMDELKHELDLLKNRVRILTVLIWIIIIANAIIAYFPVVKYLLFKK